MNQKTKIYLRKLLEHLKFYNNLAPFPVYDTEYVEAVKNKLKEVNKEKIQDYDNQPVVACSKCKTLHIEVDDETNNICQKCHSVNELEVLDNIHQYKKKYGHIWDTV